MATLVLSIGLLDAIAGLFIFKGTFRNDKSNSPARLGALVLSTLMIGSAILLVASVVR